MTVFFKIDYRVAKFKVICYSLTGEIVGKKAVRDRLVHGIKKIANQNPNLRSVRKSARGDSCVGSILFRLQTLPSDVSFISLGAQDARRSMSRFVGYAVIHGTKRKKVLLITPYCYIII